MESRHSRDVLSFTFRKISNKQTKFSLNNNTTLPWKGNTKINVPKKGVITQNYFINFCILAAQIK